MAGTIDRKPTVTGSHKGEPLEGRLALIWSLAQDIHAQRPDLQDAFADPGSEEFWIWMNCFGLQEYQAVSDLLVPIPPAHVRAFVGNTSELGFLLTGASIYRLLTRIADEVGRPLSSFSATLDFGCGPGRGLRYLLKYAPTVACTGLDIDTTAIRWCHDHFPFGEFRTNGEVPPTDLRPATFDLIYAISVFSHLAEENHLAWLDELRRLAKQDGILVLTVHGEHALRRAMSEEAPFRMLQVTRADLWSAQQELSSRDYAFIRQPGGHLNTDLYGVAFISKEYVIRRWGQDFEVLSYLEGAIDNWQGAAVLRLRR